MPKPDHAALFRALVAGLVGLASILLGPSAASALEFARHGGDSDALNAIEARGRIEPGDTAALEAFVARLPRKRATAVYLNSGGGSLDEGMALGRFFLMSVLL
jgi:hypothetical protein